MWHSSGFDTNEQKIIDENKHNGCPVCECKDTGKFITQGICGSTDSWYFCQNCGVMRRGL